jgi:hypothetical protein
VGTSTGSTNDTLTRVFGKSLPFPTTVEQQSIGGLFGAVGTSVSPESSRLLGWVDGTLACMYWGVNTFEVPSPMCTTTGGTTAVSPLTTVYSTSQMCELARHLITADLSSARFVGLMAPSPSSSMVKTPASPSHPPQLMGGIPKGLMAPSPTTTGAATPSPSSTCTSILAWSPPSYPSRSTGGSHEGSMAPSPTIKGASMPSMRSAIPSVPTQSPPAPPTTTGGGATAAEHHAVMTL